MPKLTTTIAYHTHTDGDHDRKKDSLEGRQRAGQRGQTERELALTTKVAAETVPVCAPITSRQLST